jgi:hypothetical protein
VAAVKALLRLFSYLFHALLALFLLAVSGLAMASGMPALRLGMLPWKGSTLVYVVFFCSLFGLISLVLAMVGRLRPLFFLWALAVFVYMVKGYIFSGYRFIPGEATKAFVLILCALIALFGAWFQMWRGAPAKPRY